MLTMLLGLVIMLGMFVADVLVATKEDKARKEYQEEKNARIAWEKKMEEKRARYAATGIWE